MQIREMRWEDEQDVDEAVRLLNSGKPWYPLTRDELLEDKERQKELLDRCFLMVGATAGAVGFASIQESVWERSPGKLHIELAIDPQYRRRGLATLMHNHLVNEAADHGAKGLVCYVDRTDPEWTAVAENWGYACTQTLCDVRLDPARAVVDSLEDVAMKADAAGIRIACFDALADEFPDA
ncbi:MAG: GNAT family N-acetyltransferase, partial [Armatimonadaceae bacterium]